MRRAAIVGGGPGGLAAARALRATGVDVVIIERDDDQEHAGVGITLWPNGTYALDCLGALASVRREAAIMTSMAMRTGRDRRLFHLELDADSAPARYPSLSLTRARLIDCLRDGLELAVVRGNVSAYSVARDGVTVRLESGRRIEADYLVGADGERSLVRRQLFGAAPSKHAGYLVWRGVAPLQPYGTSAICWLGRGIQFGAFPLPQQQTYWFATAPIAAATPATPAWNAELGAMFAGWPQRVREIIGATDPERLVLTHPFVYPPLKSWASGPVVLVGDAAHPMEPTLGQGACLAFEDAVVLAKSLQAHQDIGAAGACYVAARLKRANGLASQAHAFGRTGQWRSALACGLRNLAIAATPHAFHRNQIAVMFSWRAGGGALKPP